MAAGAGLLVVVGGLPASGKTTLAIPLSRELGLPLFDKDTIKQALLDCLGWEDEEASRRLGGAAMEVLFALVARQPGGAVVESNWPDPQRAAARLCALGRPLVQIHCEAPIAVVAARIVERVRSGARHPGHRDSMRPEGLADEVSELARRGWPPLDLPGPLLRVDTSQSVDVEAVANAVRQSAP